MTTPTPRMSSLKTVPILASPLDALRAWYRSLATTPASTLWNSASTTGARVLECSLIKGTQALIFGTAAVASLVNSIPGSIKAACPATTLPMLPLAGGSYNASSSSSRAPTSSSRRGQSLPHKGKNDIVDVYRLYPTFTPSQVIAKINEWGLDDVLTNIHEYSGEIPHPSGTLEPVFSSS